MFYGRDLLLITVTVVEKLVVGGQAAIHELI